MLSVESEDSAGESYPSTTTSVNRHSSGGVWYIKSCSRGKRLSWLRRMPHVVDGGWCRYIFYLFNSIRNSLETGEWYCTVYHFKLQHSLYVLLLVKLLLFRIWKFSHVLTVPAAGGVTEKTFSVPLFFQLLEHLTGILADTSLCLEDRTGFTLDDKLVISSKITLSLIWIQRWLHHLR